MKKSASSLMKRIMSMLSSIAKAKSLDMIRTKTSAMKARLIVFSLLKSKKFSLGALLHKISDEDCDADNEESKAIVLYNTTASAESVGDSYCCNYYGYNCENDEDDDDKYPDLRHSLFDEDEVELGDPNASVIDLVRNSKEEGGGTFSLEDEIDHVADLFIMKFHKRMRMQKLESFKRYQAMLERSI